MMSVMNGEEFLTQLEKSEGVSLSGIPVIVYSAEGTLEYHPQVVARPQKPISIELLFGAIKRVL
jgi:CheY-like chemotaxis protein